MQLAGAGALGYDDPALAVSWAAGHPASLPLHRNVPATCSLDGVPEALRSKLNHPSCTYPVRRRIVEAKQASLSQYITSIKAYIREATPDNPALHGYKVYSQGDEDGIIEHLLGKLPEDTGNRTFIEIGCGNGLENNSHYLLLKGYRGVWIDGSESNVQFIRDEIDEPTIDQGRLMVGAQFVDRENLPAVIAECCSFIGNKEPDFFSLDIDGNEDFSLLRLSLTSSQK